MKHNEYILVMSQHHVNRGDDSRCQLGGLEQNPCSSCPSQLKPSYYNFSSTYLNIKCFASYLYDFTRKFASIFTFFLLVSFYEAMSGLKIKFTKSVVVRSIMTQVNLFTMLMCSIVLLDTGHLSIQGLLGAWAPYLELPNPSNEMLKRLDIWHATSFIIGDRTILTSSGLSKYAYSCHFYLLLRKTILQKRKDTIRKRFFLATRKDEKEIPSN